MKYCNLCDYRSKTKKNMQNHVKRIHNFCLDCNIQFKTRAIFFLHLKKIHQNDLFQCNDSDCLKEFLTKTELTMHQKNKVKERNNKCEFCDYSAKRKVTLNTHVKTIHNFCDECNLKFETKNDIFNHLKKMHNKERGSESGIKRNKCGLCE